MNINAQRDLSIAGDVVGRDKITINITRGLDELPTRYDSRVQNFLEYYLGAKDHPAPFGGRASDLAALDAWLNDPAAPPYASLIAPAGRGKSALLAHWVTRLVSRPTSGAEAVHVVYFPISIRFNTNLETVVFASLAGRMAHIYGEKVTQAVDAQQYRGVFSDYLRRTPAQGGRVLVVMDGLDEAAGWEAGADLFPTVAPGHLHVIVAARPLALDKDETAWLNRLGWETPNRAQRLSLAGLDREGVRDVLSQMGNPLDALATKIDLISRLYELSAGDPLLVRLYCEVLLPQGAQAATLTPEDLAKLQPGLEAYFKRWFEEQQKLWGAAKPLQDKTVRGLLNLCAAALGPLKKDDVLALAPDIFEDSGLLDEVAAAVNRFIIGDGLAGGYVFSHPRLGEYFAGKLIERERQAWQARFLQYGRDTLTALENKTLLPKNAPAYVVQYYSAHLAQANAPATDFYALVCESWLRAWEWLEGTPAGFLNDADRAWQKAEAEGPAALGQQIRAALCFASVTSLNAKIPSDLLVACVKVGVISPALGLFMARQKPAPKDRAECLAAIAEFQPSEFHAIMSEALSAVRAISNEMDRTKALEELASRLPESLLGEALSVACAISNEGSRAGVLGVLASRLPESLLGETLSVACAISDEGSRTYVLEVLAPRLPESLAKKAFSALCAISDGCFRAEILEKLGPQLPDSLIDEALLISRTISNEFLRTKALSAIAPRLPEHKQTSILSEALSVARSISSEFFRIGALMEIIPRLPKGEQEAVLDEALASDYLPEDDLITITPILPEHLLGKVLSAARANSYSRALIAIALRLSEQEQTKVIGEALALTRAISDAEYRAITLLEIATMLPRKENARVFSEVIESAHAISNGERCAELFLEIGRKLPAQDDSFMLGAALAAASTLTVGKFLDFLLAIAPQLPMSLTGEWLKLVRTIPEETPRTVALITIAPRLPEQERVSVLGELLVPFRTINDAGYCVSLLVMIASLLSGPEQDSLLVEALAIARSFSDKESRFSALVQFVPWLAGQELATVLQDVLRSVSPKWSARSCTYALVEIASFLPKSLLDEAIALASEISDNSCRVEVLSAIALQLEKEEQASMFDEALATALSISNEVSRAEALNALASRWPERERARVFDEALATALSISDEVSCAKALNALASWCPERERARVFDEALATALAISNEESRAEALGALASWCPERERARVLDEAYLAVRAISDEWFRTHALGKLTPQLPENLLEEALAMVRAMSNEESRAIGLMALAPRLSESLLGEALQLARHYKEYSVLFCLAPRWSAVCRSTQISEFEELSATLRAFARNERPKFLYVIQALLPVIAEQGGEQALRETARAIVDTAKWWP